MKETQVQDPWVGNPSRIPWRTEWQPTPGFLPGKFHGQRSLVGYIQSMGLQRVRHNWATKPPKPPLPPRIRGGQGASHTWEVSRIPENTWLSHCSSVWVTPPDPKNSEDLFISWDPDQEATYFLVQWQTVHLSLVFIHPAQLKRGRDCFS